MLCETCMVSVVGSDGNLEKALDQLRDTPSEERVLGLRADHEFLRREGLLMRFVMWQSQRSVSDPSSLDRNLRRGEKYVLETGALGLRVMRAEQTVAETYDGALTSW